MTNTSKNDIIYIVNNLWLLVAGSHPVRAKVAFCFVRFSLPHKPRALCGRCKSDIKTDKTVMGVGRNNYLLNITYPMPITEMLSVFFFVKKLKKFKTNIDKCAYMVYNISTIKKTRK